MSDKGVRLPMWMYRSSKGLQLLEEAIYRQGPNYLGTTLMLGKGNAVAVPPLGGGGILLLRGGDGEIHARLNVCPHREAVLIDPPIPDQYGVVSVGRSAKSVGKAIICPIHNWAFDPSDGSFKGASRWSGEEPCGMHSVSLERVGPFLFRGPREVRKVITEMFNHPRLAALGAIDIMQGQWVLDRVVQTDYAFSVETFMDVYFDVLHVGFAHPNTFNRLVDTKLFEWVFFDHGSLQVVGWKGDMGGASNDYSAYMEEVLLARPTPKFGAIWGAIYPNITVEWYPHAFVVSTVVPTGLGMCRNVVEFYYPAWVLDRHPDLPPAHVAAYLETAHEDQLLCDRTERGRALAFETGFADLQTGPLHDPLEMGIGHYHDWIQREIAAHSRTTSKR
jgi:nitrite reductase/ring-hydroxylating ferredoxin subunit